MDGFIDSVILVDISRNYAPAVQWMKANAHLVLAITPITWMELVFGAQDKRKQSQVTALLAQFPIEYLTPADMNWAMQQLLANRLNHGVGISDCLIAAPSVRLQLPLYTQNLKHFTPLLGQLAQKPY